MSPVSCIFCEIVAGRASASIVYRDDSVCAFSDIRPINAGHLLVIPNEHAADLSELPPATGAHMFEVGQRLASALRRSEVRCEGVNLFLADGVVAGQEVFHAHLHVLPRFDGDGFGLQYAPDYPNFPPRATLDAVAASVRAALTPGRTLQR
jgi:diadenosine tetraphosphate (Ap4A) HIT family hydrolase